MLLKISLGQDVGPVRYSISNSHLCSRMDAESLMPYRNRAKPITISFFSRHMPTSVLFIQYSRYFTAASRNTCFQGWQNLGKKRKAKRWDNKHSTLTEIYNAQMISHHWPPADERQHTTVMNWRQFIRVSPPHDGWWISLHTSPTSGNKEIPRNRSKHNMDQTATTALQETAF